MMTTEHLKLLELLSTSSCVNLVTIALRVLKFHVGRASEALPLPSPFPVPEGEKEASLSKDKVK